MSFLREHVRRLGQDAEKVRQCFLKVEAKVKAELGQAESSLNLNLSLAFTYELL